MGERKGKRWIERDRERDDRGRSRGGSHPSAGSFSKCLQHLMAGAEPGNEPGTLLAERFPRNPSK